MRYSKNIRPDISLFKNTHVNAKANFEYRNFKNERPFIRYKWVIFCYIVVQKKKRHSLSEIFSFILKHSRLTADNIGINGYV